MAKEKGFNVSDVIINEALDSTCNFWKTYANMQNLYEQDDPVATVMTGNYDMWALSSNHYKANKTIRVACNRYHAQANTGWQLDESRSTTTAGILFIHRNSTYSTKHSILCAGCIA